MKSLRRYQQKGGGRSTCTFGDARISSTFFKRSDYACSERIENRIFATWPKPESMRNHFQGAKSKMRNTQNNI